MITQLERVQAWASQNGDIQGDGFVSKLVPRLRQYKEAFEMKRATILGEAGTLNMELAPQIPMDDLMFGQLDETFWQEIVADWNWLPPVT